ncbi:MAG TPA: transposase [Sedimentisphaerales bacterium]|jgi:putative transposase|nr:transposase [Sedimentisphaerales bacterium]HNU31630.1 transposase [Sedimentisphaerales bacterium]
MSRMARAIAVGCAHHITQRGNNREDVFLVDDDRRVYLQILQEQAGKYGLEILGYCLMTNHVHVVAIPRAEDSLAKGIGRTHVLYSQYINRFHKRSGHLWQGRFHSCALDRRRLWVAMKYIEMNPVRARLCRRAWTYEWSSAAAHTDERAASDLLNLAWWYKQFSAEGWRKELAEGLTEDEVARIRLRTHTGRPLGSDGFVSKLETLLGRRVRALPVGRPRKEPTKAGRRHVRRR